MNLMGLLVVVFMLMLVFLFEGWGASFVVRIT